MNGRWLLAFLLCFAAVPAHAADAPLTGRQIIDQMSDRHEAPAEFEFQTMTLVDKAGNQEVREVRRYSLKDKDGQFRYLIVFLSPAGVKGVALLTWQHKQTEDDQWMYLPAFGDKLKRIAKGGKKNYFMGTDYTFEDLVSEDRDQFKYERKADETVDGKDHFVVEMTPLDKASAEESGYKKRMLWIQKDIFYTVRTDYYDKSDKLAKRQTFTDLQNVAEQMWRAQSAQMDNFKDQHKTRIKIGKRSLKAADVPDGNFQHRYITSGKHAR